MVAGGVSVKRTTDLRVLAHSHRVGLFLFWGQDLVVNSRFSVFPYEKKGPPANSRICEAI